MHAALLLTCALLAAAEPTGGFALSAGHERFFQRAMPPAPGELPEGWRLLRLGVPTDRVEALYGPAGARPAGCAEAPLCVQAVHPSVAPAGATPAGRFALAARAAAEVDPAPLLAGLAARLGAEGAPDPWKAVAARLPEAAPPAPDAATVPDEPAAAAALADRFAALLAPDPALAARLLHVEVAPDVASYHLRQDDGREARVELRDRPARITDPAIATASFVVQGVGGLTDPPDLADRVRAAVARADDGRLRLRPGDARATRDRPPLHRLLVGLSALALAVLALGLPLLLLAAARTLGRRPVVWALLAAGAALRLALPGRLVEMGIGYHLAVLAEQLVLPRYGAGTTTLHHAVFQVLGADHAVMLWTHEVLGILTLPLAAAAGARLLAPLREGARDAAVACWAGALALTPMLLRSDLTESNLVPVLWAFWAALLAWQALRGPARVALTAAGLAFAALSRPEMVAVAPLAWLALTRPWRTPRAALAVAALLAAALPWPVAFVRQVVDYETASASLHLAKGLTAGRVLDALAANALLDPRIAPLAVVPLALGALALREARGAIAVWLLGGLAWLYVYAVDLSPASQPRLHIVGLLPWSLAAAAAVGALLRGGGGPAGPVAGRRRARAVGALAVAAWVASAAATVPTLWAPTNEDTDAATFDRARALLPRGGPYVLAVLSHADAPDPPGHYTHRHVPRYRFRDGEVVPLGALPRAVAAQAAGGPPVYWLAGVGCYARLARPPGTPSGPLPACAAVRDRYRLDPVWEEEVPNRGNPVHQELGYYGDEATFVVGLYRVVGPR